MGDERLSMSDEYLRRVADGEDAGVLQREMARWLLDQKQHIRELTDELEDARQSAKGMAELYEQVRVASHEREWWATYRAALTGLYAMTMTETKKTTEIHDWAAEAANVAHGERKR